jgi:hypothetical protein
LDWNRKRYLSHIKMQAAQAREVGARFAHIEVLQDGQRESLLLSSASLRDLQREGSAIASPVGALTSTGAADEIARALRFRRK